MEGRSTAMHTTPHRNLIIYIRVPEETGEEYRVNFLSIFL